MRNGISELVTLQSTILKELITQSERKQSDYIDSVLEQHIQELIVVQSAFLTMLHLSGVEDLEQRKKESKRIQSLRLSEQVLYTINKLSVTSNCNKTHKFEMGEKQMSIHYTKKPFIDKDGKYIWHSTYTLYIYSDSNTNRRVVITAKSQKELGKQIFLYFVNA